MKDTMMNRMLHLHFSQEYNANGAKANTTITTTITTTTTANMIPMLMTSTTRTVIKGIKMNTTMINTTIKLPHMAIMASTGKTVTGEMPKSTNLQPKH
jgi:hypothetical protein